MVQRERCWCSDADNRLCLPRYHYSAVGTGSNVVPKSYGIALCVGIDRSGRSHLFEQSLVRCQTVPF